MRLFMKKKFITFILIMFIIPCCFLFSGCALSVNKYVYVTDISKIGTKQDGTNIYSVTYSNGQTSTIDYGQEIEDITLADLFNLAVQKGYCTNDTDGFKAFVNDILMVSTEKTAETKEQESINSALQSVVEVYAQFSKTSRNLTTYTTGAGAGVIYKTIGSYSYIITNYHVVSSTSGESTSIAEQIVVYQYFSNVNIEKNDSTGAYVFLGDAINCTFIGGSKMFDIAVLRVATSSLSAVNPNFKLITPADSYTVGETAIAIGNPEAEGIAVSKGIVSQDFYILVDEADNEIKKREIVTDTAINQGNSGGGLFNADGELMGIVNAKSVWASSSANIPVENMGYALPIDNVVKVANNIMDNYELFGSAVGVKKLKIGVTVNRGNRSQTYNNETNTITLKDYAQITTDVSTSSIAGQLDLQKYDYFVYVKINGKKLELTRYYEFAECLLDVRANDTISFGYKRGDLSAEVNETNTYTVKQSDLVNIN